jgi:hypothetical protein
MFDSKAYFASHPGIAERRINPLSHFFLFGPSDEVEVSTEPSLGKAGEIGKPAPIKVLNRTDHIRMIRAAANAPAAFASPKILLLAFDDDPETLKGIRDFLRFAWSKVRLAVPEAELTIAGPASTSFRSIDRQIRMVDKIEALETLYRGARIAVNPSLAEDRLTTLAALAQHRYLVGWPGGVEGLHPSLLSFCRVATNWVEFADETISLLTSSEVPLAATVQREALENALRADSGCG